jgi:hypothetical protein
MTPALAVGVFFAPLREVKSRSHLLQAALKQHEKIFGGHD